MPKKKAGGKKGKAKEPDYQTADNFLLDVFGVRQRDIVRTPLGMEGEVLGTKTPDKDDPSTWRLWLGYPNGFKAPIDPRNKDEMASRGYRKASDSAHVVRDMALENARRSKFEQDQVLIIEVVKEKKKKELIEKIVEAKGGGGKKK